MTFRRLMARAAGPESEEMVWVGGHPATRSKVSRRFRIYGRARRHP